MPKSLIGMFIAILGLLIAAGYNNCAPLKPLNGQVGLDSQKNAPSPGAPAVSLPASPSGPPVPSATPSSCALDSKDLIPGWAKNFVPTQELYVSPTGNDSNDGLAPTKALRTARAAILKLTPGTRINLAEGVYSCWGYTGIEPRGGQAAPVAIVSSHGPRKARMDCGGNSTLYLGAFQGVIIDGLEIFNTSGYGIHLSAGDYFQVGGTISPSDLAGDTVIMNSYIHDTAFGAIKMSQAKNITIVNNEFANISSERQVIQMVAVDNVIMAGNYAHDSNGAFDEVKGGAKGGLIYRNVLNRLKGGIMVGGDNTGYQFLTDKNADYEARNLEVWDNVILNDPLTGFRVVGCKDCIIAHNTVYTNTIGAMIRILPDSFAVPSAAPIPIHNVNLKVFNNIFASQTTVSWMIPGQVAETTGMIISHNLWWWGNGGNVGSDIPYLNEPNSLYGRNPGFVSATDVHLTTASPAIRKGQIIEGYNNNADGVCWPGLPNMGAY